MTQQTDSNDRANAGDRSAGGRQSHAANQRVEKLRGGLEKAVSGRETVIKSQALKWAERLDERTQGRHHNKIAVALRAVEFIVDNAARKRDGANTQRESAFGPFTDASGRGRTSRDGGEGRRPEDLGEFRNLSDEARSS